MRIEQYDWIPVKGEMEKVKTGEYYLNDDGIVECLGDKILVENFKLYPGIYYADDIDRKYPILPKDGNRYLTALVEENTSAFTEFRKIE